jgi:LysM repeat protein
MNIFTQAQIEEMCFVIGFSRANARIASAIAMCEGPDGPGYCDMSLVGDQALANSTWGYSYGAFQIRSLRSQKSTGLFRDETMLLDPHFNCSSAYIIFTQLTFTAWTTFSTGQYRAYMQDLFPPTPGTYVVISGDTLGGIGGKLGLDWKELARLNNMHDPYPLNIGQIITLPYFDYTVEKGDTLSAIAAKKITPVTWQTIATYNAIHDPYIIYPLQKLRIPRG